MNSKQSAQYTLWLDPLQPLAASEHSQLAAAGLAIRRIQTLEDLQTALSDGQSLALIVRHDAANDLLASTIELMTRMGVALPVVHPPCCALTSPSSSWRTRSPNQSAPPALHSLQVML